MTRPKLPAEALRLPVGQTFGEGKLYDFSALFLLLFPSIKASPIERLSFTGF